MINAAKWQLRNVSKVLRKRKCDARIFHSAKLHSSIKTRSIKHRKYSIHEPSLKKSYDGIQPTKSLKTTQEWRSDGKCPDGESQVSLNVKWRLNSCENYGFREEENA